MYTNSCTLPQTSIPWQNTQTTHTHWGFLHDDRYSSPTAECRSDDLPFHITLQRWVGHKNKIAPNHADGEADRPTDMDVDVYNKTSFMIWVMLMLWHSTSILGRYCGNGDIDPCSLCEDVKAGGKSRIIACWRYESASEKKDTKYWGRFTLSAPVTL